MAYREPTAPATPRVLVTHPLRGFAAAILFVLGCACASCAVFPTLAAIHRSSAGILLFALYVLVFGAFIAVVGAHAWLVRVELQAFDDGALTMTWTRWPFAPRVRTLKLADVTGVVVETDDGTSKIVVVAGPTRIPLTGSSTSDRLDGKVTELREFLGL